MVVAATDSECHLLSDLMHLMLCTDTRTHSSFSSEKVPDYDDRKNLQGEDEAQAKHYSKTMTRDLLYGAERVYSNTEIAHERIVFST